MSVSISVTSKLIKPFNGDKRALREFIASCTTATNLSSDEDKPHIFEIIKCNITGNAGELVRNRELEDWPALKDYLLSTYSEKRSMGQYQLELNTTRQNPREPVTDFSGRIENLLLKMIDSLDASLTAAEKAANVKLLQNQALNAFLIGLRPELRLVVKSQKPEMLVDALSYAQAEELEQKSCNEIQTFQKQPSGIQCHYCKKVGHKSYECRKKQAENPKVRFVQKQNQAARPSVSANTCHYCQKPGHFIAQCRKKQYDEKQAGPSSGSGRKPYVAGRKHLNESSSPTTVSPRER